MSNSSNYEEQRKKNIERNKSFLASLGLVGAARESIVPKPLKQEVKPKTPRKPREKVFIPPERRRSSGRLSGMEPKKYNELDFDDDGNLRRNRSRSGSFMPRTEEFYTVEHINALTTCETDYDNHHLRLKLEDRKGKVGRYRKDTGTELAKSVGKTCHWCRQKDTSIKTSCATCEKSQGVICGPCLQGRYGENLFEIVGPDHKQPEWECPVCRDICNCSAASCLRQRRGWGATGALVRSALSEGYESVAHFLVLGKGFDSILVGLEAAIADKDMEAVSNYLIKCDRMKLDTPIEPLNDGPRQFTRRAASPPDGDQTTKLFCFGASATEVVGRLRQLVEEGKAMGGGTTLQQDTGESEVPVAGAAKSPDAGGEKETSGSYFAETGPVVKSRSSSSGETTEEDKSETEELEEVVQPTTRRGRKKKRDITNMSPAVKPIPSKRVRMARAVQQEDVVEAGEHKPQPKRRGRPKKNLDISRMSPALKGTCSKRVKIPNKRYVGFVDGPNKAGYVNNI